MHAKMPPGKGNKKAMQGKEKDVPMGGKFGQMKPGKKMPPMPFAEGGMVRRGFGAAKKGC